MTSEILQCWGHFGWRVFERVFALVFGIYSQKWQRRVFALKPKARERGRGALGSVHWPGHCTPVSASDSTRLHRGGRVFERMRNNTTELPAAAAFPQALFLYCCGQTNQATNMTWHSLKNSSNNHLFICFALLISSDLVYILDSGLRRVGRNFGEEELQILTYIWKFES